MKATRSDKQKFCYEKGSRTIVPQPKSNPNQRAVFVWDICPDTHEIIVVYDKE